MLNGNMRRLLATKNMGVDLSALESLISVTVQGVTCDFRSPLEQ
jgi:hypothetical protein